MIAPLLHVVLYQPDIPQNTGNIGRTCVAVGARLWLIRPLGFVLDARHLKRAGMDYWPMLDYVVVDSLNDVREQLPGHDFWYVENPAPRRIWEAEFKPGSVLVFGSESRGLPPAVIEEYRGQMIDLPMRPEVRSLNLASTVNTAVYEAIRQIGHVGL